MTLQNRIYQSQIRGLKESTNKVTNVDAMPISEMGVGAMGAMPNKMNAPMSNNAFRNAPAASPIPIDPIYDILPDEEYNIPTPTKPFQYKDDTDYIPDPHQDMEDMFGPNWWMPDSWNVDPPTEPAPLRPQRRKPQRVDPSRSPYYNTPGGPVH